MTTEQAIDEAVAREAEHTRQASLIRPADPITMERLIAIGFQTDGEKAAGEFVTRIVGGSDDGSKEDSNVDSPDDEIAELILSPFPESAAWGCFVETYHATTLNTVNLIELGNRTTMGEVIDLCRALKAWAMRYPQAV